MQILFDVASNLTGGLINDVQTMLIAVITLTVIYLGADILISYLTGFSIGETKDYIDYASKRDRQNRIRQRYDETHNEVSASSPKIKNDYRVGGLGI